MKGIFLGFKGALTSSSCRTQARRGNNKDGLFLGLSDDTTSSSLESLELEQNICHDTETN